MTPQSSLAGLRVSHAREIAHYRNLLVRAQSASSASIHELHTRLHDLQGRYDVLAQEHGQCGTRDTGGDSLGRGIAGDGSIRDIARGMSKQERVKALAVFAEGECGDSLSRKA
jgi:pyrimidine and pyridine-specific 5'-nucleotidase